MANDIRWSGLRSIATVGLAIVVSVGVTTRAAEQAAQNQQNAQQQPATSATINNIVDEPAGFYGKRVQVHGPVGDLFGPQVFNIEEQGVLDVDDELLVIAPPNGPTLTEDSNVRVSGTIRRVVTADLERAWGPTYYSYWGVGPRFFVDYENKPVLFADSVQKQ